MPTHKTLAVSPKFHPTFNMYSLAILCFNFTKALQVVFCFWLIYKVPFNKTNGKIRSSYVLTVDDKDIVLVLDWAEMRHHLESSWIHI